MATTATMRSERLPGLGYEVLFPRLSDDKLHWLAKRGQPRTFATGEVLCEHAVREAPFYVLEGLVELIDRKPGKDLHVEQASPVWRPRCTAARRAHSSRYRVAGAVGNGATIVRFAREVLAD